jgi:hypothetical protein
VTPVSSWPRKLLDLLEQLRSSPAPGSRRSCREIVAIRTTRRARKKLGDRLTVEHFSEVPSDDSPSRRDFRADEEQAQLALLIAAASDLRRTGRSNASPTCAAIRPASLAAWLLREASLPPPVDAHTGAA